MSVPSERWPATASALDRALRDRANRTVLATVVTVEGSSYRRPGAKMLVEPDGETTGALTAGCLRDRIIDAALAVLDEGEPRVVALGLDDEGTWGLESGCDGRIEVLLEPVDRPIRAALSAAADRRSVTIYTALDSTDPDVEVGDRTVETGEEMTGALPEDILPETDDRTATRTRRVETIAGTVTILVDPIQPAPRLLLFGSRPDLRPIAHLGRAVGFEVVVASPRGGTATGETFPSAHEVVASHPIDLPEHVDAATYPVLLSHNVVDDRLALEALLDETDLPYIGLLGSRDRSRRLLDTIEDEHGSLSGAQLDRLSTPVGLDLGGEGPVAVALSIVSEVFAIHHNASGGRLREQTGPIHDRPEM